MAKRDFTQRHIRLPLAVDAKLEQIAEQEGRSVTMQIAYWVSRAAAEYERQNGVQLVASQPAEGELIEAI